MKEHAEPDIVIMLVGNKLDMCEGSSGTPQQRQVPKFMAQNFAKDNSLLFMETSAYQDTNVRDCFETLVQEIYTV